MPSSSKPFFSASAEARLADAEERRRVASADRSLSPSGRDTVLHVRVVTDTGGGPDKTILLSAAHLSTTQYWVAAAYMHPPHDPGFATIRHRAQQLACPLIGIADRGLLDLSVLRRLLVLCRRLNVRIWHGHEYKSNLAGLLLRPLHSMKLVTTVHGWGVKPNRRTSLYYSVDRFCLPHYDHVISVSADLHERIQRLGVPQSRSSLLHNAIDGEIFRRHCAPETSPVRTQLGVPHGRLIVGAVGRLSAEKGFGHLIRAVHALVEGGLDIELWIAGAGDGRADLQALIDGLRLSHRVKLLGFVNDTVALFDAMDVFALSSVDEGLPNVLLEAMSMRVPLVATQVAGVPAVINDGENGLLCAAGDAAALAQRLRQLLVNRPLRERLAEAGRRTVETHFAFAARMATEKKIYDRVRYGDPTRTL